MRHFLLAILLMTTYICSAQWTDVYNYIPDHWISGTHAGYDYVDLGLPSGTLWASHNMGATSPEDVGDSYAWGEIAPRDSFDTMNYKYNTCVYIEDPIRNYFSYLYEDIGDNISGTEYDAAAQTWGNGWRLPTEDEVLELVSYCWSNRLIEENGVIGRRLCGPSTNSIFIPAGGFGPMVVCTPDSGLVLQKFQAGRFGALWTGNISRQHSNDKDFPYSETCGRTMVFDDATYCRGNSDRSTGMNIRPVYNPKTKGVKTAIGKVYANGRLSVSYQGGCLTVSDAKVPARVNICDLSGRIVKDCEMGNDTSVKVYLPEGLYVVSVSDAAGKTAKQKIIVKN